MLAARPRLLRPPSSSRRGATDCRIEGGGDSAPFPVGTLSLVVGRTTIRTPKEAGALPCWRPRCPFAAAAPTAFALQAVVKGLAGSIEVEAARQGFAEAVAELAGKRASRG